MNLVIAFGLGIEDKISFDAVVLCPDRCSFDPIRKFVGLVAVNILGREAGSAAARCRHTERLDLM